jgi:hypothetical protein
MKREAPRSSNDHRSAECGAGFLFGKICSGSRSAVPAATVSLSQPKKAVRSVDRGWISPPHALSSDRDLRHSSSAMGNGSMLTAAHHEASSPYACSSR